MVHTAYALMPPRPIPTSYFVSPHDPIPFPFYFIPYGIHTLHPFTTVSLLIIPPSPSPKLQPVSLDPLRPRFYSSIHPTAVPQSVTPLNLNIQLILPLILHTLTFVPSIHAFAPSSSSNIHLRISYPLAHSIHRSILRLCATSIAVHALGVDCYGSTPLKMYSLYVVWNIFTPHTLGAVAGADASRSQTCLLQTSCNMAVSFCTSDTRTQYIHRIVYALDPAKTLYRSVVSN
ncbi:hypothetical protein BU24DRAFT_217810 [Aaosphaeria arxii CBS 175.79]|uniref:Uncharacterized protein n=1 Tax=Aaosphaeria arxii CBS 175.79 TaxID=1450172 RepID=A0A6A5XNZ2_9PLEO|nr:uncharacterized protein BU24DRAFT_217810 [Aaosphaeria arxii CBS 175.79]KAF2014626.1 hypothetical protein BU24DRAFT_217810 [Aaosphaeria arxii CBS 175.79]